MLTTISRSNGLMIRQVGTCIYLRTIILTLVVNIVFEEEEEASKALRALALDTEVEVDRLTEREAAKFDKSKPDVEFTIRFSKIGDRKVKNAAQFSRYYLMNPEEEQKYKSAKYVSRSLREREPLGRKSRVLSDDEDDIDLFPSKAEDIVIPEEKPEEDDRTTRSSSLADRVTLSKPSRSLADRLSMLDDDDLFK